MERPLREPAAGLSQLSPDMDTAVPVETAVSMPSGFRPLFFLQSIHGPEKLSDLPFMVEGGHAGPYGPCFQSPGGLVGQGGAVQPRPQGKAPV